MAEDKGSPHGPQLFPSALKTLKRSPIWRQQQKANAKLRESLPPPQYTPEQLKTPQLPADRLVDAIAAKARAEMSSEWEPEQAPEQAIDRQAEPKEVPAQQTEETKQTKETKGTEAPEPVVEQQAEAPKDIDQQLLDQQLDLIKDPEQQAIEQVSEQAPEQAEQPAEQSSSVQPPLKQKRRGSPPIEIPHLTEALDALGKEEKEKPKLRLYPKKQVDFVIGFLSDHGVKVDKKWRKTIGRRITAWREAGSGQKPKP
jgi:hypothetical protein